MTETESLDKTGTILFSFAMFDKLVRFEGSELIMYDWLTAFGCYKHPKMLTAMLGVIGRKFLRENMPLRATQVSKKMFYNEIIRFYDVGSRWDMLRKELDMCRKSDEL